MAYLKGNTYIDGDLYVKGGLKIQKLIDPSGMNMPYLLDEEASKENYIIKFATDDGAITSSKIIEEILADSINYTITGDESVVTVKGNSITLNDANSIDINTEVSKITAQYSELIYLKKIGSLDEVGNGQEYYTDGINYYIPFDEEPGPFNWPVGLCYVESLEIK